MNDSPAGHEMLGLRGVGRAFRSGETLLRVLDSADFRLGAGEIIALVAPSGTGKSTLLHLAGLLERPDSGAVWIEGCDTTDLSDHARTRLRRDRIGFVYQAHHLLGEFTAEENIMLPQLIAGRSRAAATTRARAMLDRLGLGGRRSHLPGKLSGGEQQRVAIGRALANSPGLLLADEPTGNLDVGTSAQVFEMLLAMVRTDGLAALVATHNPDLAVRMDRIVTLRSGRIETL